MRNCTIDQKLAPIRTLSSSRQVLSHGDRRSCADVPSGISPSLKRSSRNWATRISYLPKLQPYQTWARSRHLHLELPTMRMMKTMMMTTRTTMTPTPTQTTPMIINDGAGVAVRARPLPSANVIVRAKGMTMRKRRKQNQGRSVADRRESTLLWKPESRQSSKVCERSEAQEAR